MVSSRGAANRLALTSLEQQARDFMKQGIAASTQRTYSTAEKLFLDFCSRMNLLPLPANERTLILFATELAQAREHSSIRVYLSGVRHLHIVNGWPNPPEGNQRLELVLKGIRGESQNGQIHASPSRQVS